MIHLMYFYAIDRGVAWVEITPPYHASGEFAKFRKAGRYPANRAHSQKSRAGAADVRFFYDSVGYYYAADR